MAFGGLDGRDASTATFGSTAAGAEAGDTARYGETSAARSGDEETIPVVQEQLRVGKRDTNLGRVRVRSYVVEEPVSEQVNLRQDRVEIERRPVDRALGSGDDVFTDRVIEAEEHAEEAVVSKEARVTEEVALRKRSDERTETVSDTLRHTEVEVDEERGLAKNERTRSRK